MEGTKFSKTIITLTAMWALAATGCNRQSLGVTNISNQKTDASVTDAQDLDDAQIDASTDAATCQSCQWWKRGLIQIQSVQLDPPFTNSGWYPEGIGIRMEVQVHLGGCDFMGPVDVQIIDQPSNQTILLTAHTWQHQCRLPCPAGQVESKWLVLSDLTHGEWTVVDMSDPTMGPDPNPLATFHVGACGSSEGCHCEGGGQGQSHEGDSCDFDCECHYDQSCLHNGFEGDWSQGICMRTCSTDADCALPERCVFDTMDYPRAVCSFTRPQCTSDSDCRAGFSCQDNQSGKYCIATMDPTQNNTSCTDDCDCGDGYACTQMAGDNASRICHVPCRGDGDCSFGGICATSPGDTNGSGVCIFPMPD